MEVIVGFIDENRDELGVEPICRDLQVAPSTYYAAKKRPPSARAVRDAVMIPILLASGRPTTRSMGPTSCGRRRGGPATTSAGTRWPASCARPASGASSGAAGSSPPGATTAPPARPTW